MCGFNIHVCLLVLNISLTEVSFTGISSANDLSGHVPYFTKTLKKQKPSNVSMGHFSSTAS